MSRQNHEQHPERKCGCDRELDAQHGNITRREILWRGESEECPDREQAQQEGKIAE